MRANELPASCLACCKYVLAAWACVLSPIVIDLSWRAGLGEAEIVEAAHLLARGAADELIGFAHLDVTDPVAGGAGELAVHPARRRAGVGTHVVKALLDRIAGCGSPAGARLRLWAHGEHPGAVALADRLGFTSAPIMVP